MRNDIGFVVIGRNEGSRLVDCLASIAAYTPRIVYVDSASTDQSVQHAQAQHVHVLELDMSIKFTAARARNAGFELLLQHYPDLSYVHFVDGDCMVDQAWVSHAADFLSHHAQVAVVCGRRRERYPQATPYNQLCDIEWNTPIGKAKACGGDAMMRVAVFKQVGGFNVNLIAGEEPELCIRIRQLGFDVWRLDHDMTLHDAAITEFSQWWKRTVRAGYAYAEGSRLHGAAPEHHWVNESRRAWIWGGILPALWLIALLACPLVFIALTGLFAVQYFRLLSKHKHLGNFSSVYVKYLMLGKVAEMYGQLRYTWHRLLNVKSTLIEYK